MNSKQAKQLPITDILDEMGVSPVGRRINKQDGTDELIYYAPYRSETKGSLHVNPSKNVFFDFAVHGGNPLELVMLYKKCGVKEALEWLSNVFGAYPVNKSFNACTASYSASLPLFDEGQTPQVSGKHENCMLIAEKIKPLYFYPIANYVKDIRKIPLEVAKNYLHDVYYKRKANRGEAEYFGVGMRNEAGGYEVRSVGQNKFQTGILAKSFSHFMGGQKPVIDVFEGMFDFLSLLAIQNSKLPSGDAYMLHSSNLSKYVAKVIAKEHEPQNIRTWFDNDNAGSEAHKSFLELEKTGFKVEDMRHKYLNHKDLNDFYRSRPDLQRG